MKKTLNVKQTPIYGNTKVLSPSGDVLFLCLPKRANWYLEKKLAVIISEKPLVIQLTFEPKGNGQNNDPYSLVEKLNQCVVCGSEVDLTRHHIVPYTYRKHFPEVYKTHNSHDIVPICSHHHSEYEEYYAIELKRILAERYDAQLEAETKCNSDLTLVVKYSRVLMDHWCDLPYKRKAKLIKTIREYHGYVGKLKHALLIYAYVDLSTSKTETHGYKIINQLLNAGLLQWFVETWREHFIHSMNPKYMPDHWDVKRPIGHNNL